MRSTPWPALVLSLLLLLLVSPAEAGGHPRSVPWVPGAEPVALYVASGAPVLVHLESFPELVSLELTEGRPDVQLLPAGDASFILLPSGDFAGGERALVTVRLGPPNVVLTLLLVSREDTVDRVVRLVRLRAPSPAELEVEAVARFLMDTPRERVDFVGEGPRLQGPMVRVHVESLLRLDSRLFVTLEVSPIGEDKVLWWELDRARLRVVLGDGSHVEVPLLLVSSGLEGKQQRHTLVAPLPERFRRLFLSVEGEGAPEGFFPLPSGGEESSP